MVVVSFPSHLLPQGGCCVTEVATHGLIEGVLAVGAGIIVPACRTAGPATPGVRKENGIRERRHGESAGMDSQPDRGGGREDDLSSRKN